MLVIGSVFVALLAPALVRAQSGSTLTPDRLSYVVNSDVGAERWTINLNLASLDPQRSINVTGNVYRKGQSPSFVWCQERADSTGTLDNPSSIFRLRCSGASACGGTATGCARNQWSIIADLVEIPASFFLPARGNGIARASAATVIPSGTKATRTEATVSAAKAPVEPQGSSAPPIPGPSNSRW